MPTLSLSAQAYERDGTPAARLVNLYTEQTPQGPSESHRRARPGLALSQTLGAGPIRRTVQHLGHRYTVSGTSVYRDAVQIGSLPGLGLVRWAKSDEQLVLISRGKAYVVDTALTFIADEDLPAVLDVAFCGGRFVYTEKNSGRFYWSGVNQASVIEGLDFATAESDADNLVAIEAVNDQLLMFGSNGVEFWSPTTSSDVPFIRSAGLRYGSGKGCAGADSIVRIDNGVMWLGTDGAVYRAGAVPETMSTPGIEEQIAKGDSSKAQAFRVKVPGHEFYVITVPGAGTFAFDVAMGLWHEWTSHGLSEFRVSCGGDDGDLVYGDHLTGKLWTFDNARRTDGTDPVVYVVGAFAPISAGRIRLSSLHLFCRTGVGSAGTEPVVAMRYADHMDEGWTEWLEEPLGDKGSHPKAVWRQLGLMESPGRAFEFRADSVDFLPFGASFNEPRP